MTDMRASLARNFVDEQERQSSPAGPLLPDVRGLRIALFSGNYNYLRDGANQALNRLVGYLLKRGAAVRVYSPTSDTPAFGPQGDLVSVPSRPMPFGRGEYRVAWSIPEPIRRDIDAFQPNIFHLSVPMFIGSSALRLSRKMGIPAVASMHTRFETYPRYYGAGFLEAPVTALLKRFYKGCDAVVAPCASAAEMMIAQGMCHKVGIWSRGIDATIFNPQRRSLEWRQARGIADNEVVIGVLGRLVMEKGLDTVVAAAQLLQQRGIRHRIVAIGSGPAQDWISTQLPKALFVGHLESTALGTAVASIDILFNPSETETFGNVTLEAMASGVAVVAAMSTGSSSLLTDGVSGSLIAPGDIIGFADALELYITNCTIRRTHGLNALLDSRGYDWDRVNEAMIATYLETLPRCH